MSFDGIHSMGAVAAGGLSSDAKPSNAHEAAKAFESLFLEQLMKEMRAGTPEDGLFKRGFAEKTFEEMLDRTYAGLMANRGGIGISEAMMKSWGASEEASAETFAPEMEK